jgi:hypothetical protein
MDALIAGWISRFGVPSIITTDKGTLFSSSMWATMFQKLNIHHITTIAYYPQSNGVVGQVHRPIKDSTLGLAGPPVGFSSFFGRVVAGVPPPCSHQDVADRLEAVQPPLTRPLHIFQDRCCSPCHFSLRGAFMYIFVEVV